MENHLVATTGSVATSMVYDPLGRLFQVSVPGKTIQFLYDGDAIVAEYNASTGALISRFAHGDQVDEPLLQYSGASLGSSARSYLHADHQGSIIAQSSSSGAIKARLAYDPYGIPASGNALRFGYTGQMYLSTLGLNYYKARWYSPKLGRFLQTDPIFYADDMNMYAYVGGDPLNKTDPMGLFESHWLLRAIVPGQVTFDNAMTAYEDGKVGLAAALTGAMLGEQLLTAASWGMGTSLSKTANVSTQTELTSSVVSLSRTQEQAITKIENVIRYNAKPHDFEGVRKEVAGIATGHDHVTEMRQSITALKDAVKSLNGSLNNPKLSDKARATIESAVQKADDTLQRMKEALSGK